MPISADTIETFHGARIQHGPYNRRIYLMKLGQATPADLLPALRELAESRGYTKIFAKIPRSAAAHFTDRDYRIEAEIPGFFRGTEDALLLGSYLDPERARRSDQETVDSILDLARRKAADDSPVTPLPEDSIIAPCRPGDVQAMARIYAEVFPSYPFPIDSPDYLLETMRTHVDYFGVRVHGTWVALSSAEMDLQARNVEMTDFATLPVARGHGYATHLLRTMEPAMRARGIRTAYTIARAVSPGMNITFARCGYTYGGTLVNNTNIGGQIESMNIWHRPL